MRYFVTCVVLAAVMGPVSAHQLAVPPASIQLDGSLSLPLAGQAHRAELLGDVSVYTVAIYTEVRLSDQEHLRASDTPKAVRILISYEPDLQRKLTVNWQRELVPALEMRAMTELRRIFSPVRAGDVIQIDYTPRTGTTVRVNKDTAVTRAHHDLMLAFLDHWLGQRPVSAEMQRALLGK